MATSLTFQRFLESSETFSAYLKLKTLEKDLSRLTKPFLTKGQFLTYLESLLLLAIYWGPENHVTPKNLATPFQLSPSQVSQILLQLDQKGLILRRISLGDSRKRQVTLTKKARPLIAPLVNFFEKLERV